MIIKKLIEYAEAQKLDDIGIAYEKSKLHWIIYIDINGSIKEFEYLPKYNNERKEYIVDNNITVPKWLERGGDSLVARNLVDTPIYLIGLGKPLEKHKVEDYFYRSIKRTHLIYKNTKNNAVLAQLIAQVCIFSFRDDPDFLQCTKGFKQFKDKVKDGEVIGFVVTDDENKKHPVWLSDGNDESESVKKYLNKTYDKHIKGAGDKEPPYLVYEDLCIVNGTFGKAKRLHGKINGINGGIVGLINFNLDSSCKYGRKNNENAPMSFKAEDLYIKALNHLIKNKQFIKFKENAYLFYWRSGGNIDFNNGIFGNYKDIKIENNDLKNYIDKLFAGDNYLGDVGNIYTLLVKRNLGRLQIHSFNDGNAEHIKQSIEQYFDDISICGMMDKDAIYKYKLQYLLEAIVKNGYQDFEYYDYKYKLFLSAIDKNLTYPLNLLERIIDIILIRSKDCMDVVSTRRVALIKAILNRNHKYIIKKEFLPMLDENHPLVSYHMGRLFAMYEIVQCKVNNISSGIAGSYFKHAIDKPLEAFVDLDVLNKHHLGSIKSPGLVTYFTKILCAIVGHIKEWPSKLSKEEKGAFILGYYHQRANNYTKKHESAKNEEQCNILDDAMVGE